MARSERGSEKYRGREAAKRWCQTASIEQQVRLAGCDLQYGETLDNLIEHGLDVPAASNRDFSWGFYKQVKGRVTHKIRNADRNPRSEKRSSDEVS